MTVVVAVLVLGHTEQRPIDAQAQRPTPVAQDADVIVLLDVTESVIGHANSPNIWNELLGSLETLIEQLPQGTRFAIVPFANGASYSDIYPRAVSSSSLLPWTVLETDADRKLAKEWLRKLQPTGTTTAIVRSLQYALGEFDQWAQQPDGRNRRQALYLYSDGLDTSKGDVDPTGWQSEASREVESLRQNGYPYLWTAFVRIGPARRRSMSVHVQVHRFCSHPSFWTSAS